MTLGAVNCRNLGSSVKASRAYGFKGFAIGAHGRQAKMACARVSKYPKSTRHFHNLENLESHLTSSNVGALLV